jgi:hypothetical protein
MAPGSVQVRLQDREPRFVVSLPPAEEPPAEPAPELGPPVVDTDDAVSRINLRLPDQLKARIEEAATRASLSVNAWLVRAAAAALDTPRPSTPRRVLGGDRFTGWAK